MSGLDLLVVGAKAYLNHTNQNKKVLFHARKGKKVREVYNLVASIRQ